MTSIKRTTIAEREPKPVFLKSSYAAGQSHMSTINAYNAVDAERKALFLADARKYICVALGSICARSLALPKRLSTLILAGSPSLGKSRPRSFIPTGSVNGSIEVGTELVVGLSPRDDQVSLLARWEEGRRSGPNCWLNPNFSSEATARCLVKVLEDEQPLSTEYWWWQENSELRDGDLREEHWLAEPEQQQAWQTTVPADAATGALTLAADYTVRLGRHLSLDTATLSLGGEETLLDRDLARDSRHYLEALESCLVPYGFTRRRVVEQEAGRFAWGDLLKEGETTMQLRVKIGAVGNRDLATRYDHVVIAIYTVPPHWEREEEEERAQQFSNPTN